MTSVATWLPGESSVFSQAVTCRTYTQSHMDYVIEVVERVAHRASGLPDIRTVPQLAAGTAARCAAPGQLGCGTIRM